MSLVKLSASDACALAGETLFDIFVDQGACPTGQAQEVGYTCCGSTTP
jgi:hypothetical protein